jgi:2-polyprenyl-3-methyl-5-hydroxy-6-metoxy-1,4-benzoquinol methylase
MCPTCHLVFKNPDVFLSDDDEVKRYKTHNNTSTDQGYVDFLYKLVNPLKQFLPKNFSALDFGCGPGPTMPILLEELGGKVESYDPIFFPDAHLLIPESYDVVTSTEVVEHFKNPSSDWTLMVDLVKDGGVLAVMTLFFNKDIDYKKWWYKNDTTHIVFYKIETMEWIAEKFNLEIIFTDHKSITIFRKREL